MRGTVATLVTALLVTPLLFAACGDDGSAADDRVELPGGRERAGLELPDFDGGTIRLADYEGRPLVVNLFASWCAPCVSEMPAIERVKQDVGDEVAFLGIAVNDRVEDALALIERTGITWDVARDPQGELTSVLEPVGMPTTYLLDADGEIVEQHTGELSDGELRDLLEEHFGVVT